MWRALGAVPAKAYMISIWEGRRYHSYYSYYMDVQN
jgi:hypothetical protein